MIESGEKLRICKVTIIPYLKNDLTDYLERLENSTKKLISVHSVPYGS
jgi:hypothetical protein